MIMGRNIEVASHLERTMGPNSRLDRVMNQTPLPLF